MCGISGIALASKAGRSPDEATLLAMRDEIVHRGPDDAGLVVDGPVGLAHRRLSIVDLDHGQQPIASDDGNLHLVFNGEIYNHAEYRVKLAAAGHTFRTQSDTEIILHLYDEYGDDCVDHMRGMFAFALWDTARQRLLIARDRLGIKPLYYHIAADGSLYFGSEIKAILAAGDVDTGLNTAVLPDHLVNLSPSGVDTLYRNIQRLPGGCCLTWQDGDVAIRRYWDIGFTVNDDSSGRSSRQMVDAWREQFESAVTSHLMADVPVGVLLSGGIDSTAIAAMMRRNRSGEIHGFSVAFGEKEANELEYARLAAAEFDLKHHVVTLSSSRYFELLPRMIWHEDEPIAYPASIPLYAVCELAAENVKVVLTGEGADELMAGYGRYPRTVYNYRLGRWYERLVPGALRTAIRRRLLDASPGAVRNKLTRTFLARDVDLENLYFNNFSAIGREQVFDVVAARHHEALTGIDPFARQHELLARLPAEEPVLNKLLYVDMWTYLHELLMKQDQMSMATSIESRVPFLDRDLVDFTTRLPTHMKLRGTTTKYVLRKAMQGIVPEDILKRPKWAFRCHSRAGFGIATPPSSTNSCSANVYGRGGILDTDYVARLVAEHRNGAVDRSQMIWGLLNFEIWQRMSVDGDGHRDISELIARTNRDLKAAA